MKEFFEVVGSSRLFAGLDQAQTEAVLRCLCAETKQYEKGEMILRSGETTAQLGMMLSGMVHIVQEDFWGNQNILGTAEAGQIFAEAFACTPGAKLTVHVIAQSAATVLFLNVSRMATPCSSGCAFHSRMIQNVLADMAVKNLRLNAKVIHMAGRTIREKLLSYLSDEAKKSRSAGFTIPYNRRELADYLSVDRSAMCRELGRLRVEGVLRFERNRFTLLELEK